MPTPDPFSPLALQHEIAAITDAYLVALWDARAAVLPDAHGYVGWDDGWPVLDGLLTARGYALDGFTECFARGDERVCVYTRAIGGDVLALRVAGRLDRLALPSGLVHYHAPTLSPALLAFGIVTPDQDGEDDVPF